MNTLSYSFQQQTIIIQLKHSAKKNIIIRPIDTQTISINIPPYLSERKLIAWLRAHEDVLQQTLAKAPSQAHTPPKHTPEWIWYQGEPTQLQHHEQATITHCDHTLYLPQQAWRKQQKHLRHYLQRHAAQILLPTLAQHSHTLQLIPAAIALSNAKTFWGVCRQRTGIRLNWRLIGAPQWVLDYVCIHELCHLPHPNHSPAFWQMVNQHTPHTQAAKQWLKQHGNELFILG